MRILKLTLTKKWFTEIYLLRKPEEYRTIKKHWVSRICTKHVGVIGGDLMDKHKVIAHNIKHFDAIEFTNGYGNHMPKILIESKGISIGRGNPDWGAPIDTDVFILSLGKILETKNIK